MPSAVKVKTRYRNDMTGSCIRLPAILTEKGLLISHLRYLASRHSMSASWRERAVFSVILLIKFIHANEACYFKATDLLRAFARSLSEGTIDSSTLHDPSNLYWSPRKSEDSRSILAHITCYTDWLSIQEGHEEERINPFRKASSTEQRLNWCAYYHKKHNIFLSHLFEDEHLRQKINFVRDVRVPITPIYNTPMASRFPEKEIKNLLSEGFVNARANSDIAGTARNDYKCQAITLLLHYAGLRKSEALYLYLCDIFIDSRRAEAVVKVHHPSLGVSPDSQYRTRKEYLAKNYGLSPRTDYFKSERLHLGWKTPLLSDRKGFFVAQFFPPNKAAEFLNVWVNYLKYQRVDPKEGDEHPYAFTNSNGRPETLKNYQRLHKAAVERIGLDHGKAFGTSEHGHRHSYGYRLAENGFTQVQIQKAMHHKSPESCMVYIQPSDDELLEIMRAAE